MIISSPDEALAAFGSHLGIMIFALAAFVTHILLGYFGSYVVSRKFNPWWGVLGGVIPDIDNLFRVFEWGFPWTHRGLTHTPFMALLVASGLIAIGYTRTEVGPLLIGWFLHLVVDTFTGYFRGVAWLYPFKTEDYSKDLIGYTFHSFEVEPFVWITGIMIVYLLYKYRRHELEWVVSAK